MTNIVRVAGTAYKVTEDMGYLHDIGMRAAFVTTPFGEKVAVWDGGEWRFWTAKDRMAHSTGRLRPHDTQAAS